MNFLKWLNFKHSLNRLNFEHRSRLEQRFLSSGYQNRFRYRIGFMVNLNQDPKKQSRFFLSFNNELYIPLDGIKIEKNRLFTVLNLTWDVIFTQILWTPNKVVLLLQVRYHCCGNLRRRKLYSVGLLGFLPHTSVLLMYIERYSYN